MNTNKNVHSNLESTKTKNKVLGGAWTHHSVMADTDFSEYHPLSSTRSAVDVPAAVNGWEAATVSCVQNCIRRQEESEVVNGGNIDSNRSGLTSEQKQRAALNREKALERRRASMTNSAVCSSSVGAPTERAVLDMTPGSQSF
jgi:hypothetical protein